MDRIECKYNTGVWCLDPSKCDACGWNPAEAKRRIESQKAAPKIKIQSTTEKDTRCQANH